MPRQPRKTPPTSQHALNARDKQSRAYEMRKVGATMYQIAIALGYSNASGAFQAVQREIARRDALALESHAELRSIAADQLNDLHRHTMEVLARRHPLLHRGRVVVDAGGKPYEDDMVRLRAIETALKVEESIRRLFGVDAPARHEVTGEDGAPIPMEITVRGILDRVAAAQKQQLALPPGDEFDEPQEA